MSNIIRNFYIFEYYLHFLTEIWTEIFCKCIILPKMETINIYYGKCLRQTIHNKSFKPTSIVSSNIFKSALSVDAILLASLNKKDDENSFKIN